MSRWVMRFVVCLLVAIACGCGTYAVGAIVWSCLDPENVGAELLFTIPIAIVATAVPALFATIGMLSLGDWDEPVPRRRTTAARTPRPFSHLDDDADVRLAAWGSH